MACVCVCERERERVRERERERKSEKERERESERDTDNSGKRLAKLFALLHLTFKTKLHPNLMSVKFNSKVSQSCQILIQCVKVKLSRMLLCLMSRDNEKPYSDLH